MILKKRNNYRSKIAISLFFASVNVGLTHAQSSPVSAGGDQVGPTGSVSYSVGQVVYTPTIGIDGNSNQGVQQPYELFTVEVSEFQDMIGLTVFPNPATEQITIQLEQSDDADYFYELVNAEGKLIDQHRILTLQTTIQVAQLPVATYFLKVSNSHNQLKVFRLVKSN